MRVHIFSNTYMLRLDHIAVAQFMDLFEQTLRPCGIKT